MLDEIRTKDAMVIMEEDQEAVQEYGWCKMFEQRLKTMYRVRVWLHYRPHLSLSKRAKSLTITACAPSLSYAPWASPDAPSSLFHKVGEAAGASQVPWLSHHAFPREFGIFTVI